LGDRVGPLIGEKLVVLDSGRGELRKVGEPNVAIFGGKRLQKIGRVWAPNFKGGGAL